MFVLLYIAATLPPAQLGLYFNEESCIAAIRGIYEQRIPPQHRKDPKMQQVIDITMKYQRDYRCQPQ